MPAVEHVHTITRFPAAATKSSPSEQQYGRIHSVMLYNIVMTMCHNTSMQTV